MGSGKTTAAIKYMNEGKERYLYITPFLDEADRIFDACPNLNFAKPSDKGMTKLASLKELMRDGRNIVSTHQLFAGYDDEVLALVREKGYVLIMDEVTEVIEVCQLPQLDIEFLFKNDYLTTNDDGIVLRGENILPSNSCFSQVVNRVCNTRTYFVDGNFVVELMPVQHFTEFKDIIILTYMFDASIQRYYYDIYNIDYSYIYVTDSMEFTNDKSKQTTIKPDASLFNIYEDDAYHKYNAIGDNYNSLSRNWTKSYQNMLKLKNMVKNIGRAIWKDVSKKKIIWTTFKGEKDILKNNDGNGKFVVVNARSTNEFANRDHLLYCANMYMHPAIKLFVAKYDIEVNERRYALSEMLQWIYRSAIRKGQPIYLYIPSRRMRSLLHEWLGQVEDKYGKWVTPSQVNQI